MIQVHRMERRKDRGSRAFRGGSRGRIRPVITLKQRKDGSYQMLAEAPSGRWIWVIWRFDREDDEIPDIFGEVDNPPIFVITAY